MADAPVKPVSKAGTKVTVGCKLPHGLLLELYKNSETIFPDGSKQKQYVSYTDPVSLNGANSSKVVGGYGLTSGIDADFIEKWLKDNEQLPAVKNGLIFVVSNDDAAISEAVNRKSLKTGFERLDPNAPGPKLEPVKSDED